MKIGIATYHQVINDGAILQAYAQQQALQKLFPEGKVEIIDFRYKLIEQRERYGLVSNFVKMRKSSLGSFKRFLKFNKFIRQQLVLSKQSFVSDDTAEVARYINENYDAVVVGSDEVWKIEHQKFGRPFPSLYWLPEPINTIRIAGAATANTTKKDELTDQEKKTISSLLGNFQLMGLRDQFTYDLVKEHSPNANMLLIPDPTFALEFNNAIYETVKNKLLKAGLDLNKPIIGFSMSSNVKGLAELSSGLYEAYKKLGYQVVSIGQYNKFSDVIFISELNPLEWAHIYRFFQFCVTDRFHSTIFSIRNSTNFVSVDSSSRYADGVMGKMEDLLKRIGLTSNYINLRNIPAQDAVKKVMEIHESGNNEQFKERLRAEDATLVKSYGNFLSKVKELMENHKTNAKVLEAVDR